MKNIVIVDVDVDYNTLLDRMKNPAGGFVSLEYFFDADDQLFAELEKLDVLYSQAGGPCVVESLMGKAPFDGVSTGNASLAKAKLDGQPSRDGHSRKIRDAVAARGGADRILRICHTQNLFRKERDCVRMFCRSMYVDPATLEQTPCRDVQSIPPLPPDARVFGREPLFDFLAMRKRISQRAETTNFYRVLTLAPRRDYETDFYRPMEQEFPDFDSAWKAATQWLLGKNRSGELQLDNEVLKVHATNVGEGRKPKVKTEALAMFRNRTVEDPRTSPQSVVVLDGAKLVVRYSQPVALFVIQPGTHRKLQYQLSESEYVESAARMLESDAFREN